MNSLLEFFLLRLLESLYHDTGRLNAIAKKLCDTMSRRAAETPNKVDDLLAKIISKVLTLSITENGGEPIVNAYINALR